VGQSFGRRLSGEQKHFPAKAQRRKGFRKKFFSELGAFAPLREEYSKLKEVYHGYGREIRHTFDEADQLDDRLAGAVS
jgi:hypothetical protein